MTDDPEVPGSTPEEQEQAATHAQFSTIADLCRKATETHISTLAASATAPLLDPYNLQFAVLCGVVSAAVTSLVGAGDAAGDDDEIQESSLNTLFGQMAGVFHEILERKARIAAMEAASNDD